MKQYETIRLWNMGDWKAPHIIAEHTLPEIKEEDIGFHDMDEAIAIFNKLGYYVSAAQDIGTFRAVVLMTREAEATA